MSESHDAILWLIYFTCHCVLKVHPCSNMCQNELPFKGWVASHRRHVSHFVYPSICNGHWTRCPISMLALWTTLLWTLVHRFFSSPCFQSPCVYLCSCPGMEWPGNRVTVFRNWDTAAAPLSIPTNVRVPASPVSHQHGPLSGLVVTVVGVWDTSLCSCYWLVFLSSVKLDLFSHLSAISVCLSHGLFT